MGKGRAVSGVCILGMTLQDTGAEPEATKLFKWHSELLHARFIFEPNDCWVLQILHQLP